MRVKVNPLVVSDSLQHYRLQPPSLLCPWNSPGKNTGVGCHILIQGIFPTQGLNRGLPHCRRTLYHLSHQGSPYALDTFSSVQFSSVTQLCPTLCDPMDCSLPGSSVHGILQARILEWVATSFSRGSSQFRNRTYMAYIAGRFFTTESPEKPDKSQSMCLSIKA